MKTMSSMMRPLIFEGRYQDRSCSSDYLARNRIRVRDGSENDFIRKVLGLRGFRPDPATASVQTAGMARRRARRNSAHPRGSQPGRPWGNRSSTSDGRSARHHRFLIDSQGRRCHMRGNGSAGVAGHPTERMATRSTDGGGRRSKTSMNIVAPSTRSGRAATIHESEGPPRGAFFVPPRGEDPAHSCPRTAKAPIFRSGP